jgi:flagellar basal-body rod protein FlgB
VSLFDVTQVALNEAMSGSAARQQALANNIANANTPNFTRSDLDFQSQLASALQSGNTQSLESLTFSPQADTTSPVQADGNNVDVDTEMSDMSENALDYESLVQIANARLKMLSDVIGSGSS